MHDHSYNKETNSDLPDLCALLSSLVRLMSCYVKEPCINQAMTLLHLMGQIDKHPELASNPAAEIAIKQAKSIWLDELNHSRALLSDSAYTNNDDGTVH